MDTDQIRRLEPKLIQFLNHFDDCFGRKDTRAHLGVYVRGQLSELPEKSVDPIALEADVAPRTLQEFLPGPRQPAQGPGNAPYRGPGERRERRGLCDSRPGRTGPPG